MKIETALPDILTSYDWQEAFKYAPFTREDIAEVLGSVEGENDADSWVGVFLLKDGRYGYLTACCDYTGWGCLENGEGDTRATLDAVVRELCGDDDRRRLGVSLPEDLEPKKL